MFKRLRACFVVILILMASCALPNITSNVFSPLFPDVETIENIKVSDTFVCLSPPILVFLASILLNALNKNTDAGLYNATLVLQIISITGFLFFIGSKVGAKLLGDENRGIIPLGILILGGLFLAYSAINSCSNCGRFLAEVELSRSVINRENAWRTIKKTQEIKDLNENVIARIEGPQQVRVQKSTIYHDYECTFCGHRSYSISENETENFTE